MLRRIWATNLSAGSTVNSRPRPSVSRPWGLYISPICNPGPRGPLLAFFWFPRSEPTGLRGTPGACSRTGSPVAFGRRRSERVPWRMPPRGTRQPRPPEAAMCRASRKHFPQFGPVLEGVPDQGRGPVLAALGVDAELAEQQCEELVELRRASSASCAFSNASRAASRPGSVPRTPPPSRG